MYRSANLKTRNSNSRSGVLGCSIDSLTIFFAACTAIYIKKIVKSLRFFFLICMYICMYFMLTYLRNGFGESDPDAGLAANSNSRSGVFGCSFSSWSFSSSSSSKDLNFGTMGVLSRPGSG